MLVAYIIVAVNAKNGGKLVQMKQPAAKAYAHETYKGKAYYFCCPECKPAFDKNPSKVIASAAKGKYQPM